MGETSDGGAVLLPTGRKLQTYACLRSFARHGVRSVVASEYDRVPLFSSRYCDERVRLPASPADLPGYRDALLELAARPDVETVVPVREFDAYVLSRYAEEFEEAVSLVVPDAETLARAHDRLRLARAAERAGVPYAETRRLSAARDWAVDRVVKSRYNVLGPAYVDGVEGLREARSVGFVPADAGVDPSVRERMGHEPIVQAYVPQAEKVLYTALWVDGEPLAAYQHRQIRQNSWVGGGGVYRRSTAVPAVTAAAEGLLGELEWTGLACIEYVRDADTGEWKFLEINPRTWQSLPEAVRAGADFPYYYLQAARGDRDAVDLDYPLGVGCHVAYGELGHVLSLWHDESPFRERPSPLATVRDVVVSCLREPRFDYLRADDPGLAVSAVREALLGGEDLGDRYGTTGEHRRTARSPSASR